MALEDLEHLEKLEFPVFSCLCELCDCGEHKHHQNCRKNTSAGVTDPLLSHYQSTFIQPLHPQPRSSKRPLRTPPYQNPPAMQVETTQRSAFKQKPLGQQGQLCAKKKHSAVGQESARGKAVMLKCSRSSSLHSSSSASCHSNKKATFPARPPATAGVHDLNTTYKITYQPLPIEKGNPPSKKRAKPKSAPIESISTYRKDYPIYTTQALRRRPLIFQVDNLHINRHLPADFNTIQRDSYIGWDTNKYPRRDPIILKNQLKLEGTIDTNTVTKLTYTGEPFNDVQDLNRPMTMQSACGGKFHSGTAYTNSFRPWEMRSRVRHGDVHDGAYVPPPSSPSPHVSTRSLPTLPAPQGYEDLTTPICRYAMTPRLALNTMI
ncbi:uncharacterized protein LOC122540566 isoform X2 [Chiloscyllium plagiosum]|uniref:uncharacterized protein LOC122540566 isoform X2 n=1 Tax=Chiloscyllium plagiosum TaxID=36176 RepID=UPI001CB844F8|nr:uncharacterized protein LOC122540566 isoform X2 [Chiloscyllium plagiosum]